MTDKHARAGEIMRQMLPPENVAKMENPDPNPGFGGEFARLAYEHAAREIAVGLILAIDSPELDAAVPDNRLGSSGVQSKLRPAR